MELIDNKLSYDEYISGRLKQAGAKINSIKRLGHFLSKILSLIVWHFEYISNIHKIEKLHEIMITFIHSDYNTDYFTLLKKVSKSQSLKTLHASRLENICKKWAKSKVHE